MQRHRHEEERMSERVSVLVHADDPLSESGVRAQLHQHPRVLVIDDVGAAADVGVLVVAEICETAAGTIRRLRRGACRQVVVVAGRLDERAMLTATEAGASGMLRRAEAYTECLVAVIHAAASGEGSVPADLLGRLLEQVGRLQRQVLRPQGLTFSGLTEREIAVLRLLANGCDTAEIAEKLSYSERTVRKDIQNLRTRLHLRNRSHAVAYALREGLI
jgi:DNA-binding NarL/FixJ family response regulator